MECGDIINERTFLVCDAMAGNIVLNVVPSGEHLLELLSDGYGAESLDDIARWAANAELGDVFEGAYICIIRVKNGVEVPVHGEIR